MHLAFQYWDQVAAGQKCAEYRADTAHWRRQLAGKTHVVLWRGFEKKLPALRILEVNVLSIEDAARELKLEVASAELNKILGKHKTVETMLKIRFETFEDILPEECMLT